MILEEIFGTEEEIEEARTAKKKTRVRNQKVQRRKKTCQPGYKLVNGKCVRQGAQERRSRTQGAKKANRKGTSQRKRSQKKSNRVRDRRVK